MNVGIVIDDWKLGIFERHLIQAGYSYVRGLGLTEGTILLNVSTENVEALTEVVVAATTEAANMGRLQ